MADTGYDSHAAVLPRRASGYAPAREGVVNADYVDMTIPQGAGGLYSTTRDLLKVAGRAMGRQAAQARIAQALCDALQGRLCDGRVRRDQGRPDHDRAWRRHRGGSIPGSAMIRRASSPSSCSAI
ncbi:MAG: serine hydrolase [Sphingomonas sp.]